MWTTKRDEDEEIAKDTRPVFRARPALFLTSYLLLLTFYFLLPTSSFAQDPLKVTPDTINFGRVRIGEVRDSFFSIQNVSTATIQLQTLTLSPVPPNPEYTADNLQAKNQLLTPGTVPYDTVHFIPTHVGPSTGIIPIYWIHQDTNNYPSVYLIGTGVGPEVTSSGVNFGNWRVDSSSPSYTIPISNIGTDTTAIESVTIMDSTELKDSDFQVSLDSLPTSGFPPLRIGYEGRDSVLSFTVQFQPHSIGMKTFVIRIRTIDGVTVFDTITGKGVEPLVLLNARIIDLGTIMVLPHGSPDSTIDTSFVVSNASGTYSAILDTLTHNTTGNFSVQLLDQPTTSQEPLPVGDSVMGTVKFTITAVGDFFDTIRIPNDTRYYLYDNSDSNYQPMIILKAKVRIGPIGSFAVSFDTITNCNTVSDTAIITNPYPVEASIGSIAFISDTAGFSRDSSFGFPINVPPNSSYPLTLYYSFPPDSLNGSQALKMALFQSVLDSEPPVVDTITANVVRQQQVLALAAHLPLAGSVGMSAADIAELRVPITLKGLRTGVTELNSWTLSLQFSNDLFVPTGIDLTGSLSATGDTASYWDQSTRTFTFVATGTAVSDPANSANDLLLTILMQAYVTTDTVVTVTPTFTWVTRPCAYNLQSFTLSIPYAEDCGDATLREAMDGGTPSFILTGSWPNPATESGGVSIGYNAAEACEVTATVFSESGEELGHFETTVGSGAGTIALPEGLIPASGPAFVRVEAVDANGSNVGVQTCKIAVMK